MLPRYETAVLPMIIIADLFVQHLQPFKTAQVLIRGVENMHTNIMCIVLVNGSAQHNVIFNLNYYILDTIMHLPCM